MFAVALGVAVGAVLRRSLAAMAVTLAVYVFVQVAVPIWVRPHLIPPVRQTLALGTDTIDGISLHGDGPSPPVTDHRAHRRPRPTGCCPTGPSTRPGGRSSRLPSWFAQCLPPPPSPAADQRSRAAAGKDSLDACLDRLSDEGYRQQLVYQPANRFWSLQWAETGVFAGLSGLLAWFSFWWVRRRLT